MLKHGNKETKCSNRSIFNISHHRCVTFLRFLRKFWITFWFILSYLTFDKKKVLKFRAITSLINIIGIALWHHELHYNHENRIYVLWAYPWSTYEDKCEVQILQHDGSSMSSSSLLFTWQQILSLFHLSLCLSLCRGVCGGGSLATKRVRGAFTCPVHIVEDGRWNYC